MRNSDHLCCLAVHLFISYSIPFISYSVPISITLFYPCSINQKEPLCLLYQSDLQLIILGNLLCIIHYYLPGTFFTTYTLLLLILHHCYLVTRILYSFYINIWLVLSILGFLSGQIFNSDWLFVLWLVDFPVVWESPPLYYGTYPDIRLNVLLFFFLFDSLVEL